MELGYDTFIQELDRLMDTTRNGTEYWRARDIQPVLGYSEWRNFEEVIEKAKKACDSADVPSQKHFVETTKMVALGGTAQRELTDWFLTRLACYIVAMTADGSKREVAFAKQYFAVQTRRQEIFDRLPDDEKRIQLRNRVRVANKALNRAAKSAGVQRYGIFHDAGYRGLYGGLGLADIKALKKISRSEDLLDRAGRAELAANEFRITQAEQKLGRDQIKTESEAIEAHREVGREVRATINRLGGTMPETLPPETPIKKLVSERKKQLRGAKKELP